MKKNLGILIMVFASFYGCAKNGAVVAKIGGDKISAKMVQERLAEAPPSYQGYLNTDAGRKQFVDLLVRERIVLEAARRAGADRTNEYKKALSDFKKEQVRRERDYEESLLMELYVRQLHEKEIGSTDKDINKYYEDNKKDFTMPVEIVARHILVPTREEAEKVLQRLKAGEDFSKIAKEVSTDPVSAQRGGEIGPFRKGDLVPEFEKAVFGLKIGRTSGVVETQFGFHVVKKMSEKALPTLSAEDSKVEIKKILEKGKFDAWLEREKNELGVKINYELLSKIPKTSNTMPEQLPAKVESQTGK